MYDGGSAGLLMLPRDAEIIVCGPAEAARLRGRYPNATFLFLDHDGSHPEWPILDFEKLYVSDPRTARRWALAHWQAAGTVPTIYANPHNYQRLAPALAGIGWDWWVMDQTGVPHAYQPPPGWKTPVATQWFGSRQPGWRHYDISLVTADSWPGGGTASPEGGTPMAQTTQGSTGGGGSSGGGTAAPWWVVAVQVIGGKASPAVYETVQSASRPPDQQGSPGRDEHRTVAGPFATQAAAQAWISGQLGTGLPHLPHISLPNPLTGIAAVGDFFSRLGQASTWIRVGEVILGIVLIAIGIARITNAVPIATKIAAKAAGTAAIA